MEFTTYEIRLAMMLKEDGLQWKPQVGDWYFHDGDTKNVKFVKNGSHTYVLGADSPNLDWWDDADECVFIPSWRQCRELLKAKEMKIALQENTARQVVELTVWHAPWHEDPKERKVAYVGRYVAPTDLEAIFQGVLEVISM